MGIQERYSLWLEKAIDDKDLIPELESIAGDDNAIAERFTLDLEFGTAGLRGIIGAGTYRMNIYTIRRATQGLAEYLIDKFDAPSVAIAYDSRIKSDVFAKEAAKVLAGNGVKAYLFPELMPTPVLSFAVRELKTSSGIVVTASHNPSKYNGYKVYGPDGCQMTDEAANAVLSKINNVDIFEGVKVADYDKAISEGMIEIIGDSLLDKYLEKVRERAVNPDVAKDSDLSIIYTPLNGTGNKPVRRILADIGIKNVTVVKEQENPDGNFPTAPYPNPEIRQSFECALKLSETVKADLLLATDPDADRVGIAVKDGDDYRLITGNEVGCMLLNYILSERKANGTLPGDPVVVKTIVSTPLADVIGKSYDVDVINVLTGFKYIGEQIGILEEKGEEDRFVFGFEESYGYLGGSYVRDKDAVIASMLICEMAAFYKKQGKSLIDILDEIYTKYGMYINAVANFAFEGLSGMETMKQIMSDMRADAPTQIAGFKVTVVSDYLLSKEIDVETKSEKMINLPKSNVLSYQLENGCKAIVRPSGTEPKIKVYITAKGADKAEAEALGETIKNSMTQILGV